VMKHLLQNRQERSLILLPQLHPLVDPAKDRNGMA